MVFAFYELSMHRGPDASLTVTRRRDEILVLKEVTDLTIDDARETGEEHLLLLRSSTSRYDRVFFLDHDKIQTNIREVVPTLRNLEDTIRWLLPTDYVDRQGDIGVYSCAIPSRARFCPWEDYEKTFAPVLNERHVIDRPEDCLFATHGKRRFVSVLRPLLMVHPEHPPITIPHGEFELVKARGMSFPILQYVRDCQPGSLLEL
jgi:hypothetical protein